MAKTQAVKATKRRTTAKKTVITTPAKTSASAAAAHTTARERVFTVRRPLNIAFGAVVAEFIGTFLLALVIVNYAGNVLVALIALVVLTLLFAPVSGAHLNPAFSIASWAVKRLSGMRATAYVVAQVLGAMLALVVANVFLKDQINQLTGASEAGAVFQAAALPTMTSELWKSLGVEAFGMLVFALGFARFKLSQTDSLSAAFTMGGSFMIGLLLLQGSPILNPAVAITVSALHWSAWSLAIYIIVPVVVSVLALYLYRGAQTKSDPLA